MCAVYLLPHIWRTCLMQRICQPVLRALWQEQVSAFIFVLWEA